MTEKLERVQKLMSNQGYCSRRYAEELIEDGRVKVNGKTITIGDKATYKDKIAIDGKTIQREKQVYLMLNKHVFGQLLLLIKQNKQKI